MKPLLYSLMLIVLPCSACKKEEKSSEKNSALKLATEQAAKATSSILATTIQFSGYTWNVKHTGSSTMGPGPNYWNQANVWVDGNGYLHLRLNWNATAGRWECAEVVSTQTFGNGTYQWQIDGPVNALDRNVVLGFFNYNGVDGLHEMDIEFARWGIQSNNPLNYTVYPTSSSQPTYHYTTNFSMSGTLTTHRFKRTNNAVVFKSLGGHYDNDTNLFATATCQSPYSVSNLSMPIHMNLWLFQGNPPSNSGNVEIIVRNFKFTP